jgi:hypothetical protein
VRSGYDDAQLPDVFDDAAQARGWLPLDWHPDHFAVDEANAALSVALAEPVAVTGELADLFEQLERRGIRSLREVLGPPLSHGPTEVTDDEAGRMTETYRVLLDLVGDGVALTSAGYLPPKLVEQFAERTGITRGGSARPPGNAPRRGRPRHGGSPRAGFGPEGPAHTDRCRRPHSAGPRASAEVHRRASSAGHQGLRSTRRLDGLAVAGSGEPAAQWHEQVGDLPLRCG